MGYNQDTMGITGIYPPVASNIAVKAQSVGRKSTEHSNPHPADMDEGPIFCHVAKGMFIVFHLYHPSPGKPDRMSWHKNRNQHWDH